MAGTGQAHLRERDDVTLVVDELVVEFPGDRGRTVHAVSGISFDVVAGETLGVVGESGCGKSSTGRAILQLPPPTSGRVVYRGTDLTGLGREAMRSMRHSLQMIFQDPVSSLNPRRTIGDLLREPLRVWGPSDRAAQDALMIQMLDAVGLDRSALEKRPHQFSGGQCQRIAIARALIVRPELIICDEPVSALDVSIQAQILGILRALKSEFQLTLVFISHDLAVVKNISDRVIVMYLGKICEVGDPTTVFGSPAHPYTSLLVTSSPAADPAAPVDDRVVEGVELPSPLSPPSGCRFRTRCPRADDVCATVEPTLTEVGSDQFVACHHPLVATDAM